MANNIVIDAKDFLKGADKALSLIDDVARKGTSKVAEEILRLSQFEVPHDTGLLQNSGHVEADGNGQIVGYNKVYAARLHENPQYNFQKGRKGKYLEDPIKNNLATFTKFLADVMKGVY